MDKKDFEDDDFGHAFHTPKMALNLLKLLPYCAFDLIFALFSS